MSEPDVFDRLPKVELHCHVEGTIRPSTVLDLARQHGLDLPLPDPLELYRYTSLDSFLSVFWLVQSLLRTADDWERAAYESLVDAVPHGLRYREMFFTPARHLDAGQDLGEIVAGLTRGIERAETETGVRARLIADMDRSFGPAVGLVFVEAIVRLRERGGGDRIIGVGMDSTELGVDLVAYAPAMRLAAANGLRLTAHAGEAVGVGAANIAIALDDLGAERIDHGIAIVEDEALLRRVARERIPVTVCPNSNILIANRYPRLEDHPFRAMRDAGLLVTINTDDPAMTNLDLGREYGSVARAFAFDVATMAAIALEGIESTWLDASEAAALRTRFEQEIASLV